MKTLEPQNKGGNSQQVSDDSMYEELEEENKEGEDNERGEIDSVRIFDSESNELKHDVKEEESSN